MEILQVVYIFFGGNAGNDLGRAGLLELEGQHLKALSREVKAVLSGACLLGRSGLSGSGGLLSGLGFLGGSRTRSYCNF